MAQKASVVHTIGENLQFSMEDGMCVIRFDPKYRGGRSKTGKSIRVFSTEGNRSLPELPAIYVGLNAYAKE